MTARVLIADDHVIVLDGLVSLLANEGFTIVGTARDGREAVRLATDLNPDIAVLDLGMPHVNGLDATRELSRVCPETRVVILTMHAEEPYVLEALRAGARGYVLKTQATEHLVLAIREVARGSLYMSPGVSEAVADAFLSRGELRSDPLTPRERDVLRLLSDGKPSREIASLLRISVRTVEAHRAHIMGKLGIHDTAGLVRYAIRRGLIVP